MRGSRPSQTVTDESEMKPYTNTIPGTQVSFAMVPIPGGEFVMGSPDNEPGRKPDEGPQHKVKISPFWMGQCEVTWNEYELFMYPDEERRTRATVPTDAAGDKLADAVTHPSKPYVEMSFGMGKDGFPAISHDAARRQQVLPVAQRQDRTILPPAHRGRMGIRRPRRHDDRLFLRRRREQAGRIRLVRAEQRFQVPEGRQEEAQSLGPLRHLRQRRGMGASTNTTPTIYKQCAGNGGIVDPWNKATKPYPHSVRGGSWDDEAAMCRSAARRGSDRSWKMQDPQLPEERLVFLGRAVRRLPHRAPAQSAAARADAEVLDKRRRERLDWRAQLNFQHRNSIKA